MMAFWVTGTAATTTEALEAATQLSRSSIRNTFGSKQQLLLAALDRYLDLVESALVRPLRQGREGLEDVLRFFEEIAALKATEPGSHGCLVVNLAAELPDPPPATRERIDRYHCMLGDSLRAALGRAARGGEIPAETVDTRSEVLRGLAIAVNWTARAAGPDAAVDLAAATRRTVDAWRTEPGID